MSACDRTLVQVRPDWNAWQTAEVRVCDLHDIHWLRPLGAPRATVHGCISCADIVRGEIPHSCNRALGPHRLLVCVLKKDAPASMYLALAERANQCASVRDERTADSQPPLAQRRTDHAAEGTRRAG